MELSDADAFRAHFRGTLKLLCGAVPWRQIKAWVLEKEHELDSSSMAVTPNASDGGGDMRRPHRPPRIPDFTSAVQRGETGKGAERKGGAPVWIHNKHQNRNRGKGDHRSDFSGGKGRKGGWSGNGKSGWIDHGLHHGSVRITPAQRVPLFDVVDGQSRGSRS